ncbi:MAG TPA: DUF6259 domain-containing protein [Candidatus Paceibacterota bacterium]|nr:DUF6259 domain-containing protein [Verrucomicrobiota bacterium]HRY51848.1 DUF6259 domain-containing protein [Candidatus Paceibacterota bacterium]
MNRRDFLKTTSGAIAMGPLAAAAASATESPSGTASAGANKYATVRVDKDRIRVETHTLSAVFIKGFLTSLKCRSTGEEFIQGVKPDTSAALELIYRSDERVPVDLRKYGSIVTHPVSDQSAEIVFNSWDGDGVILVSADPETGSLWVEPSAFSSRPGVRACRWNLEGLRSDLNLVAPFFQGIKLPLEDPLIRNSHWGWPFFWEAGLAILQGKTSGFWIHTQDNRYHYKALQVGSASAANQLGLDMEAFGPIDNNLSAGGLVWRLNVYDGDWTVPAGQYRQWLWDAYHLRTDEQKRPAWIHDVKFAISWCPGDTGILDALAKRLDPKRVLLHYPNWRTDPYDENYPAYVPSEAARKFIAKGQSMGFRVMPHFNAIDMDPSHPSYAFLRDFQYRGIDRQDLRGWSWYEGRGLGVPESNASRQFNRDKKVMVKIHPGLGFWRSLLGRNIREAAQGLGLETVFIDVTLVSHNLHNCFIDATTPTEGMNKLIRHVASLGSGLVVGGEGLNEITMQGQSFAQAHLFKSWQTSTDGLERTKGCPLNEFLFGRLCRTIGYSGLSGRNASEELRMNLHVDHGAIPTITLRSAADIENPNAAVQRMLDLAGS